MEAIYYLGAFANSIRPFAFALFPFVPKDSACPGESTVWVRVLSLDVACSNRSECCSHRPCKWPLTVTWLGAVRLVRIHTRQRYSKPEIGTIHGEYHVIHAVHHNPWRSGDV